MYLFENKPTSLLVLKFLTKKQKKKQIDLVTNSLVFLPTHLLEIQKKKKNYLIYRTPQKNLDP